MKNYRCLNGELYNRPLLIAPTKALEIQRFMELRNSGIATTPIVNPQPRPYTISDSGAVGPVEVSGSVRGGERQYTAVLPLFGTLWQHGGVEMDYSGGTSTEQFGNEFSKLIAITSVKTIIIEVHSGGGQAWGTGELSDLIYNARQSDTRIVAVVNSFAASAALWIATAAHEVVATVGADLGSIGVVVLHEDISRAEEKAGVKTTLIAYPEKKIDGHPFAPLSDEVRSEIESDIKATYQRFVAAVARNRGVSTAKVERDFGGGGMLRAQQAVAAGLADRIATKQQVVNQEVRRLAQQPKGKVAASYWRNRIAMMEN